ncbi:hypothetical protein DXG01_014160 [Tephrocybe rancida]|nr:hypothetical protein DXG01_014160 [Tephrocybe rancida]
MCPWLPEPTYQVPDRTKKSHARRQSVNHIPRPRNAFILFRCDFVRQQKVPLDIENNHRNLSRISGGVWRLMTPDDRRPWVRMAEEEKLRHKLKYPNYTYRNRGVGRSNPLGKSKKDVRKVKKETTKIWGDIKGALEEEHIHNGLLTMKEEDVFNSSNRFWGEETTGFAARRHSSCPPGAPRFLDPAPDPTLLVDFAAPRTLLVTRDDLARRPSSVVMYTSTPISGSVKPPNASWAHLAPTSRALIDLGTQALDVRPPMNTGPYVVDYSQFGIHGSDQTYGDINNVDLWDMPHFTDPFPELKGHVMSSIPSTSIDASSSLAYSSTLSTMSSRAASDYGSASWVDLDTYGTNVRGTQDEWDRTVLGGFARMSLGDPSGTINSRKGKEREAIWNAYTTHEERQG